MKICQLCNNKFPTYCVINGKRRNLCRRKYCLECSPFNLHNTKVLNKDSVEKFCNKCKTTKNKLEFYFRRNGKTTTAYCKDCTKKQAVERQRKFKQQCVEYKGGKCQKCGYYKYFGALEFHHKDKTKKLFSLSQIRLTSFNEKAKNELNKCDLLCSNCHKEIEFELNYK